MSRSERDGPFRISAVARLTGVPEPTIRAWEQRYGVPRPRRTESGYRLYSRDDVALVQRIRELCERGLATAEAARSALTEQHAPREESPLVTQLLDATATLDAGAFDDALAASLHVGTTREMIEDVFAPVLHRLGEQWRRGTTTVVHEHFASERINAHLQALLRVRATRRPRPCVIVAAYAEEHHMLSTLAVALAVSDFVEPVVLGARTPPDAIEAAVRARGARAVLLSSTIAPRPSQRGILAAAYGRACKSVPWLVGGAAAPEQRAAIEAAGGATTDGGLDEAVAFVSRI